MMENGCCPTFEDGYILFDVDDNTSKVKDIKRIYIG